MELRFGFEIVALAGVCLCHLAEARGGGSKRTFGSPKSNSQNQNLGNCSDPATCLSDPSDSSSSVLGATLALVLPLMVLLALIAVIKLCLTNAYPKGYHKNHNIRLRPRKEEKDLSCRVAIRADCCDKQQQGESSFGV